MLNRKGDKAETAERCIHETSCSVCKEKCFTRRNKSEEEQDHYHCIECLKTYHKDCDKG